MLKQLFDVNPDETDFEVQFSLQQDYWVIALLCLAGFLMYAIYLSLIKRAFIGLYPKAIIQIHLAFNGIKSEKPN